MSGFDDINVADVSALNLITLVDEDTEPSTVDIVKVGDNIYGTYLDYKDKMHHVLCGDDIVFSSTMPKIILIKKDVGFLHAIYRHELK